MAHRDRHRQQHHRTCAQATHDAFVKPIRSINVREMHKRKLIELLGCSYTVQWIKNNTLCVSTVETLGEFSPIFTTSSKWTVDTLVVRLLPNGDLGRWILHTTYVGLSGFDEYMSGVGSSGLVRMWGRIANGNLYCEAPNLSLIMQQVGNMSHGTYFMTEIPGITHAIWTYEEGDGTHSRLVETPAVSIAVLTNRESEPPCIMVAGRSPVSYRNPDCSAVFRYWRDSGSSALFGGSSLGGFDVEWTVALGCTNLTVAGLSMRREAYVDRIGIVDELLSTSHSVDGLAGVSAAVDLQERQAKLVNWKWTITQDPIGDGALDGETPRRAVAWAMLALFVPRWIAFTRLKRQWKRWAYTPQGPLGVALISSYPTVGMAKQ